MRVTPTTGRPFRMWGSVTTRTDADLLVQLACGLGVPTIDIAIARGTKGSATVTAVADGATLATIADDGDQVRATIEAVPTPAHREQPQPSPFPTPRTRTAPTRGDGASAQDMATVPGAKKP